MFARQPSIRPWIRPRPPLRLVPGVPFSYDRTSEQYFIAPAGPYDSASVWDAETEAGNYTIAPRVWSPSGLALTFGADGVPLIGGPYVGRQTFDYREWDVATQALVPVSGGGTTATYVIGNASPVLGTISDQFWSAGVDSFIDLDISDADDALEDLILTGTLPSGVTTALHTYLPGDPGEYQRWRLEFSLAHGAGNASGTINDLTVTDPYGGAATFAAFNWARVDGVQVPNVAGLTYETGYALVVGAGFESGAPVLVLDAETPGNIVETSPSYPDYVTPGSQITVYVSAIAVPNVIGLTASAAETALSAAGLNSLYSEETNAAPVGEVFAQDPIAATLVLPDALVTFVASSGAAAVMPVKQFRFAAPRHRAVYFQ